MQKKIYRIPQRLNSEFLLAGFTVPELLIFITLLIGGIYLAVAGFTLAISVPAVYFTLHIRLIWADKTVRELLAIRLRYLRKFQSYGMQECERRTRKKK